MTVVSPECKVIPPTQYEKALWTAVIITLQFCESRVKNCFIAVSDLINMS